MSPETGCAKFTANFIRAPDASGEGCRRRRQAMDNDEIRMTKSERSPKPEIRTKRLSPVAFGLRISDLIRHSSFVIRVFPPGQPFVGLEVFVARPGDDLGRQFRRGRGLVPV